MKCIDTISMFYSYSYMGSLIYYRTSNPWGYSLKFKCLTMYFCVLVQFNVHTNHKVRKNSEDIL